MIHHPKADEVFVAESGDSSRDRTGKFD